VTQGIRMAFIAASLAQETRAGRKFCDVEVASLGQRCRFPAAYQRRVWAEAEACPAPGQVGSLLRREGLSASHLTTWRRPRAPEPAAPTGGTDHRGAKQSLRAVGEVTRGEPAGREPLMPAPRRCAQDLAARLGVADLREDGARPSQASRPAGPPLNVSSA
jgi:hypothetical protein